MSTLLIQQVESTSLTQEVTPLTNLEVYAIDVGIYSEGSPAGSVFMEVQSTSGGVIATSTSRTILSLKSDTYAHGTYRFGLDVSLKANTAYHLVLATSGYSFSSSDFIGWLKDFDFVEDDVRITPASYSGALGYNSPFQYRPIVRQVFR